MQGPAYAQVFTRRGIAIVTPDEADQQYVHDKYMSGLVRAEFRPETRRELLAVIDRLSERNAIDGVILGGTELPLILKDAGERPIPFLDTRRIHVEAALDQMLD